MLTSRRIIKTARLVAQGRQIPAVRSVRLRPSDERHATAQTASHLSPDAPPASPGAASTADEETARCPLLSDLAVASLRLMEERKGEVSAAAAEAEGVEREVERLRTQAWEEGWNAGYAAGKEEAASLIAVLQNVVDETNAAHERLVADSVPQLLKLAVEIAEKIIRREIETAPTVVEQIVAEALQRAVGKRRVQVRVNPEDLDLLQAAAPELRAALDGVRRFEIVPDRRSGERRMARGGCLIETEGGVIDARIETQLEEVGNQLTDER